MAAQKYTTKKLRMIAFLWMAFPLVYLVLCRLVFRMSYSGILQLILSPWYWIVSALAVVAGLAVLRVRWHAWYLLIASNVTISYQTVVLLVSQSQISAKIPAFLSLLLLQLVLTYLVGKEIRVPYFFPKIRWWESDPRYKLSVQTKVQREGQADIDAEIMDLSIGGCFIKTHSYFAADELVTLNFLLFEKAVQCRGFVVWRTESTVTHPKGIGIKFDQLSKSNLDAIKKATKKLKKLARAYNQMTRERNWQEYLAREQKYQNKK